MEESRAPPAKPEDIGPSPVVGFRQALAVLVLLVGPLHQPTPMPVLSTLTSVLEVPHPACLKMETVTVRTRLDPIYANAMPASTK